MKTIFRARPWLALFAVLVFPLAALASAGGATGTPLDLTATWYGISAVIIFIVAYGFVINEEFLHLRKSKPVVVAAGIIWLLVALAYQSVGDTTTAPAAVKHNILEYAELLLFLLAAMTYVNTMQERNVFEALRAWLVSSGFSFRAVFWLTGVLAFFISPLADNLTTALVMAAVVLSVGAGNPKFVALACINIVVAANAGGAFSPFGDITTLMVWQKGLVKFAEFIPLFIPSVVNWLVPAIIMSFAVPKAHPNPVEEHIKIKPGGVIVIFLFILTISITVSFHNFLHMPPVLGMMTGLGLLKLFGFRIRRYEVTKHPVEIDIPVNGDEPLSEELLRKYKPRNRPFDIFISMKRAEWDTLMFFYGVVLSVGGLGALGYLAILSDSIYVGLGPTWANVLVGIASAIVDNIPIMFAVLTMEPDMDLKQWLLVTLTAGVGGSMLSIGSAAGVALMGQARGVYTFFTHLRWTWAIALGYAASIWAHLVLN
ncbi:MAG TPA: sodium:proton antiporter [Acidiferrobacteraceae bacterium]|nr:sodium:proton antiporter [Acidiferrobacteraceae bacterium]